MLKQSVIRQKQRKCVSLTMRIGVKIRDTLGSGHWRQEALDLASVNLKSIVFAGNRISFALRRLRKAQ
jgi:hypothetical protein